MGIVLIPRANLFVSLCARWRSAGDDVQPRATPHTIVVDGKPCNAFMNASERDEEATILQ
jgi:hypothetical protein